MAHGRSPDTQKALQIAVAAAHGSERVDEALHVFYIGLIAQSLGEAARRGFYEMISNKFKSEFAKKYIAMGRDEGLAMGRNEGRAETLLQQLKVRFNTVDDASRERILNASKEELVQWAERVLTAPTLEDVLC